MLEFHWLERLLKQGVKSSDFLHTPVSAVPVDLVQWHMAYIILSSLAELLFLVSGRDKTLELLKLGTDTTDWIIRNTTVG